MQMPDKIGGRPGKGPGLSVTVISAKPKGMPDKIGGPIGGDEESLDGGGDITSEQAMDDASQEIIASITSIKPNPKRLREALRAFVQACRSEDEVSEEESM